MMLVFVIALFLSFALVPITLTIWLLAYAARSATQQVGRCRQCRYDLAHLEPDRRSCPECGFPFYVNSHGEAIS